MTVTDPRFNPLQFDQQVTGYETTTEQPLRRHLEEPTLRTVAGDLTGNIVIELGCGPGIYTRRLRDWGAERVIGADISPEMIARAQQIETAEQRGGLDYIVRDLTQPCECEARFDHLIGHVDLAFSVYALCYASTLDGLIAMCRNASADLRPGGRLIAAVANPGYADERDNPRWYAHYGFQLTAPGPVTDGTPLHMTVLSTETTPEIHMTAFWWSAETYEYALKQTGFTDITWQDYTVDAEGISRYGTEHWSNYLARPHARIIQARRSATAK
ncbi:class I SAM-dependent methyltransferase [Nocardia sp. NPDC006044]|uniref:class I SAM-dependent methyltransferase n=1 Tax=Nocardia sp. NPDC006044 TaxID=3364306 RepID=UPI0036C601AF